MKLTVGIGALRAYQRLPYKTWEALAEFVDNAVQAYQNNKKTLDASYKTSNTCLEVHISADKDSDKILISDNSSGMNRKTLESALVIGGRPGNDEGLSEYGMGMKTAAIWFGSSWKIRTKTLGETVEHQVRFKLPKNEADSDLPSVDVEYKEVPAKNDLHYTMIEITDLEHPIGGKTKNRVRDYLGSIYRMQIKSGDLKLFVNQEPCVFNLYEDTGDAFHKMSDGTPWRQEIEPFTIETMDSKGNPISARISGWAGLLDPGGREKAGFSIVRRGRVLQGWPNAWKPNPPFGDQEGGSNTSLNQRLVGEIWLDDRMPTDHTKSAPLWRGDDEEVVAKEICKRLTDLISEGKLTWGKRAQPTRVEMERAVDEAVLGFSTSDFATTLKLIDVPSPSVIAAGNQLTLKKSSGQGLLKTITLKGQADNGGDLVVRALISQDLGVNDLYLIIDALQDRVDLLLNASHPYFAAGMNMGGEAFLVDYVRNCLFDGIAEWKARRHGVAMEPETMRNIKNSLMLSIGVIDENR